MSTNPRRVGKYELQERLGRGGMAEVWKAFDSQLQRHVAIKFLHTDLGTDPDFMKRFEREAQAMASLRHPNIVQIHDFLVSQPSETESAIAYIVMDYIEGQTLADYIRGTSRAGKFPAAVDIVHIFTSIGSAIDYAHRRGMIHRDIKPTNILLDKYNTSRNPMGEPILMDFGIVKLTGASTSTLSGSLLGTPLYISPEQALGQPGNERSDIYAFGVILYEICTGVRPFQGDSPAAIMMQHISAAPTPPAFINPAIPPALTEAILRSLAKDPAARFPNASSMATVLAQALNISPSASMNIPTHPVDVMNGPPSLASPQTHTPSGMIPSLPSLPEGGHSSAMPPAALSTPQFPVTSTGQGMETSFANLYSSWAPSPPSMTPINSIAGNPSSPGSALSPSGTSSPPSPELSLLPKPAPGRQKSGLFIALAALLIMALVGAGLSTFYLRPHQKPPITMPIQIAGQAYFVSSNSVDTNSSQGIDDQLQINLQNIPAPSSGKHYFAWLLSDKNQNPPTFLPLGALSFNDGSAQLFYPGDSQYDNLLGSNSRLLITEETTKSTPNVPSPDHHYYAELPQAIDPSLNTSALDYLRALLYQDLALQQLGIHGGSNIQFYRNTRTVWNLTTSAQKDVQNKDYTSLRTDIISILDYLDGTLLVQKDPAISPNTPVLVNANVVPAAQVALRYVVKSQTPLSYWETLDNQLNGIKSAPGVSAKTRTLATQTDTALAEVFNWLKAVHDDAILLLKQIDTQQPLSSATLDDMATQADNAYNGFIDPFTNQSQIGVKQIYTDIQQLAVLDVTLCETKGTGTTSTCG